MSQFARDHSQAEAQRDRQRGKQVRSNSTSSQQLLINQGDNGRSPSGATPIPGNTAESVSPEEPLENEYGSTEANVPHAQVWQTYLKRAEYFDKELVDRWDRELDTFLIYAGLFSAILSAFVIETRTGLQDDLLNNVVRELRLLRDPSLPPPPPFRPSDSSLWVNGLWLASLVLSLVSALCASLGKGWAKEYQADLLATGTPRRDVRRHRRRFLQARRWRLSMTIATLPFLLHISLFLFLIGLVVLLRSENRGVANPILALVLAAVVLYFIGTFVPFLYADFPYTTPISHAFLKVQREWVTTRTLHLPGEKWARERYRQIRILFSKTSSSIRKRSQDGYSTTQQNALDAGAVSWLIATSTDPAAVARAAESLHCFPSTSFSFFHQEGVVKGLITAIHAIEADSDTDKHALLEQCFLGILSLVQLVDPGSRDEELLRLGRLLTLTLDILEKNKPYFIQSVHHVACHLIIRYHGLFRVPLFRLHQEYDLHMLSETAREIATQATNNKLRPAGHLLLLLCKIASLGKILQRRAAVQERVCVRKAVERLVEPLVEEVERSVIEEKMSEDKEGVPADYLKAFISGQYETRELERGIEEVVRQAMEQIAGRTMTQSTIERKVVREFERQFDHWFEKQFGGWLKDQLDGFLQGWKKWLRQRLVQKVHGPAATWFRLSPGAKVPARDEVLVKPSLPPKLTEDLVTALRQAVPIPKPTRRSTAELEQGRIQAQGEALTRVKEAEAGGSIEHVANDSFARGLPLDEWWELEEEKFEEESKQEPFSADPSNPLHLAGQQMINDSLTALAALLDVRPLRRDYSLRILLAMKAVTSPKPSSPDEETGVEEFSSLVAEVLTSSNASNVNVDVRDKVFESLVQLAKDSLIDRPDANATATIFSQPPDQRGIWAIELMGLLPRQTLIHRMRPFLKILDEFLPNRNIHRVDSVLLARARIHLMYAVMFDEESETVVQVNDPGLLKHALSWVFRLAPHYRSREVLLWKFFMVSGMNRLIKNRLTSSKTQASRTAFLRLLVGLASDPDRRRSMSRSGICCKVISFLRPSEEISEPIYKRASEVVLGVLNHDINPEWQSTEPQGLWISDLLKVIDSAVKSSSEIGTGGGGAGEKEGNKS